MKPGAARPISLVAAAIFGVALTALLVAALFPYFPRQLNIREGDTAARTVRSPRAVSFESTFLTEQRRDEAAEAVPETRVFDPSVRTGQIAAFDRVAVQVTGVRALADPARQREALAALGISQRSAEAALALAPERWSAVVDEGRQLLDDALGISLDDAAVTATKDALDAQVSPEFTAAEAALTAELVRPLIVSTLAGDDARTQEAREAARASVPPQLVNVARGDVILSADSRVDEVAIEKLEAAGLLSRTVEWRNVIAVVIIAALAGGAVAGYLYVMQPPAINSERHLISLAIVTALPLLVLKLYLPVVLPDEDGQFLAYILPLAAAPMLIAALLETDVAVLVAAIIGGSAAFVGTLLPDVSLVASVTALDTMRLALVYTLPPVVGLYFVHRADRLNRYLTAGLAVTGVAFLALLATWFLDGDRETTQIAWMALSSSVSGIGAGVIAAGAFVTVGVLFGVTTRVQLMELSQLNSPLLRRLQDDAAGTFHHSVIVGNLAERAADLIGADALLTRVGCYYHDIGKVLQPGLYIENQTGESPHEDMSPEDSAREIQQHVVQGLELARRERLPVRVQAFIPEHHGTRLVAYFYRMAAERDPNTDPADYQYPGPKPQSRETAIVMLADSTEAVVRSSPDRSPERIDQMVDEVVAERLAEGQLDECDLTLRDLRTIAESFKSTMRAVYHPRVQYPRPTEAEARRRVLRLPLLSPLTDRPPAPRPRPRR
jgi:putative nucleotidyltransferase with HDIG domain